MTTIRIAIADDHSVIRTGLRLLLTSQPDMQVVGEAFDGDSAVDAAARLTPNVLLLDLTMPGGSGIRAIERIRAASPATRVVVLTMHDDPALVRAALAAGAHGFVVKTAADSELISAIRAVSRGRAFVDLDLPAEQLRHLLGGAEEGEGSDASDPLRELSRREREVFEWLAKGHSNQEIAARLDISIKTVETYRSRIREKLGLQTRADFTRFAVETGIIGPGKFGE